MKEWFWFMLIMEEEKQLLKKLDEQGIKYVHVKKHGSAALYVHPDDQPKLLEMLKGYTGLKELSEDHEQSEITAMVYNLQ